MPLLLYEHFYIDCRPQPIMESISFRRFLKGNSQNLEDESIQIGTTGAVEGENGCDLTNTLETT